MFVLIPTHINGHKKKPHLFLEVRFFYDFSVFYSDGKPLEVDDIGAIL